MSLPPIKIAPFPNVFPSFAICGKLGQSIQWQVCVLLVMHVFSKWLILSLQAKQYFCVIQAYNNSGDLIHAHSTSPFFGEASLI